jgi:hypothetical protein
MDRSLRLSCVALAVAAAGLVALAAPFVLDLHYEIGVKLVLAGPVLLIGGGTAALIFGRRERSGVASGLGCAAIGAGVLVLAAIVVLCILIFYALGSV